MPGVSLQTIYANQAFIGAFTVPSIAFEFHKAAFDYAELPTWLNYSGLKLEHQTAGDKLLALQISSSWPESWACNVDGAKLSASFSYSTRSKQSPRELGLIENVSLLVEDFGKATIGQIQEKYCTPLSHLLTLAANRQVNVREYSLFSTDAENDRWTEVHMLYLPRLSDDNRSRKREHLTPFDFIFTLGDVSTRLEAFFASWFEFRKNFPDFINLFFSYAYSEHTFLETRFTFLMFALVSYFRQQATESSISEFSDLRNSLMAAKEIRDQGYSDLIVPSVIEFALPTLIQKMLEDRWTLYEPIVGTTIPAFLDALFYAWDRSMRRVPRGTEILVGRKLHWLTERLLLVLKFGILEHLGFSEKELAAIRDRNQLLLHMQSTHEPWPMSAEGSCSENVL
jgi:hypothetical protein